MRTRTLVASFATGALAVACAVVSPAAAGGRRELILDVGRTGQVQAGSGRGGASLALSLVWPLEERFRVGLTALAESMGDRVGRLVAPGGADLGPVLALHRAARGAGCRMEARLAPGRRIEPYILATWGLYSLVDDVRGATLSRTSAVGAGAGIGIVLPVGQRNAAGFALRFQQLSRGATARYATAALEWRWGMGATE